VGLIKAALSLKHRVLFPNLHCANLSPLIDFANSAVFINKKLTPWEPACGVRRVGVSSFGIMGTNVHAVLEEAPLRMCACPERDLRGQTYWIPISARSASSLESNVAALKRWIERFPSLNLADLQHTLVRGRGHYSHRFCATASDIKELSTALSQIKPKAQAGPWMSPPCFYCPANAMRHLHALMDCVAVNPISTHCMRNASRPRE